MDQLCTAAAAQPHLQSPPSGPRQTSKSGPLDLQALLQETAAVFHAAAHGRPVDIVFDIDSMLPRYLLGDGGSLKQVLFCLGGNAIRSTEQGEMTMAVELEQLTRSNAHLIFSLRDSGNGNRLQASTPQPSNGDVAIAQRFAGSAEDLAECLRLVEQLGGELELMSPAQGAGHFQLCLGLRRDRTRPTQASVADEISDTEFPWLHGLSVKKT